MEFSPAAPETPHAPADFPEIEGYQLFKLLGSGGMGEVYAARDTAGRDVALKLLHPWISADPQAKVRLRREVQTLQLVKSPYIAHVLDFELDDVKPFLVTELIDGPTLDQDVKTQGAYTLAELQPLAHGVAAALEQVHLSGVVHRDLKPGNVMLSDSGPKLIDFGIAQTVDDERLTKTGLVTGTPGFLDPEVVAGSSPTPAGDWWSFAAVILFAATGRPPFGPGSTAAVLTRVESGRPDVKELPWPLARVLKQALDPDPARRASSQDILRVLDALVEEKTARAAQIADLAVTRALAVTPLAGSTRQLDKEAYPSLPDTRIFTDDGDAAGSYIDSDFEPDNDWTAGGEYVATGYDETTDYDATGRRIVDSAPWAARAASADPAGDMGQMTAPVEQTELLAPPLPPRYAPQGEPGAHLWPQQAFTVSALDADSSAGPLSAEAAGPLVGASEGANQPGRAPLLAPLGFAQIVATFSIFVALIFLSAYNFTAFSLVLIVAALLLAPIGIIAHIWEDGHEKGLSPLRLRAATWMMLPWHLIKAVILSLLPLAIPVGAAVLLQMNPHKFWVSAFTGVASLLWYLFFPTAWALRSGYRATCNRIGHNKTWGLLIISLIALITAAFFCWQVTCSGWSSLVPTDFLGKLLPASAPK